MTKRFATPAEFSKDPRPPIELQPVTSSQVKAVGYDPATQTLAVQFTRGTGAIYHYPEVTPEQFEAFRNAESLGKHFDAHIKALPFTKYPAEPESEAKAA